MMRRKVLAAAIITTVLGFAPAASVLAAASIANAAGCRLDEGSVHPCVIIGVDWGSLLYTMGVMGWLMLVTAPLMLLALALWFILAVAWLRDRLAPGPPGSGPG